MRNAGRVRGVVIAVVAVALQGAGLSGQEPATCTGPTSRDPSWSPDGGTLVFTSDRGGPYDLWTLDLGTHELRRLTESSASEFYPRVSPAGREVAFTLMEGGTQRVAAVSLAGGEVRLLTAPEDDAADPTWTREGRLVFSSARGGSRDLWEMEADGSDPRRLFALDGEEWAPRISPDGGRIAFQSDPEGDVDLFTARLDGSDLRRLTNTPGFDGLASWSPDGRRIDFYSRALPADTGRDALRASWLTAELYVMAADGLELPTPLTRNRHRDQSPTWSPGGERIAFTSCGGGNLEVWMVDGSGGDGRPVTRVPTEAVRADRLPAPEDSLAIVSAVEGYVRGWRDGDVARLGEVLAPEGVIIWTGSSGVRTMTFEEALANRRPNPGFGEPWRLEALRVVDGRMAVAEVDIAFGEGEGQYTDVLTLYKTDGRWWIVGKAYSLRRGG